MLLLFRLGRPDVLPLGDLGVRKGFARTINRRGLADPRVLMRRAERRRAEREGVAPRMLHEIEYLLMVDDEARQSVPYPCS